jgi:hypothetical protein
MQVQPFTMPLNSKPLAPRYEKLAEFTKTQPVVVQTQKEFSLYGGARYHKPRTQKHVPVPCDNGLMQTRKFMLSVLHCRAFSLRHHQENIAFIVKPLKETKREDGKRINSGGNLTAF